MMDVIRCLLILTLLLAGSTRRGGTESGFGAETSRQSCLQALPCAGDADLGSDGDLDGAMVQVISVSGKNLEFDFVAGDSGKNSTHC